MDDAAERSRPAETSGRTEESPVSKPDYKKFRRGRSVPTKLIKDKKLRGQLQYKERLFREAQEGAAKVSEWLLPSEAGSLEAEGVERTWQFQQADILQEVGIAVSSKVFDLSLDKLGPYRIALTRNGRYMALGGRKGHLAVMDWQRKQLACEVQVKETVKDVCFLHNETFFAAAQKKYCYIYDKRGMEVHCLKHEQLVNRLDYLPHHWLLVSVGETGVLNYRDTSTGYLVANHKVKLGPLNVLTHNPWNAVVQLGHGNGTVTMWTPNMQQPVVKMLCHSGPVRALAVDPTGQYLVSVGADQQVKVWDIRTYKPLQGYMARGAVQSLDVSQRGMVALSYGRTVQVWQDALSSNAQAPYLTHRVATGNVESLRFAPFEDVLCIGSAGGIGTMLVPGSGEPNFDSWVADPFQTRKGRQTQEVVQLLDKLQADTIVLDPTELGALKKEPAQVQKEKQQQAKEANMRGRQQMIEKNETKKRMKGKNKPSRRAAKKQRNIIEARKPDVEDRIKQQAGEKRAREEPAIPENAPSALHKFFRRK